MAICNLSYQSFSYSCSASMVRVQNKMIKSLQILEYFTTHEWTFLNKNVLHLQSKLTESDRKVFDIDVTNIKWVPYMEQYVLGVRRYILKEKDKDIPKAKLHMKRYELSVHVLVMIRAIQNDRKPVLQTTHTLRLDTQHLISIFEVRLQHLN